MADIPSDDVVNNNSADVDQNQESTSVATFENVLVIGDQQQHPPENHTESSNRVDLPLDPASLRGPIHVADIGREGIALFHSFGTDLTKRSNLFLIENNVMIYVAGNSVLFENVRTLEKEYLICIDDGGVGCVVVHPSR